MAETKKTTPGTLTTGISFDVDFLKEVDKIAAEMGINRSRFVQLSVRNQIKLHRKQSVRKYLDSLDDKEIDTLKDEAKKRGLI